MSGLDRHIGGSLDGMAHLAQSIEDILTTPVGTRVMRRGYGSRLPELIDAPINDATIADIYQETADALVKWEPRFKLRDMQVLAAEAGQLTMSLSGTVADELLEVPVSIRGRA